MAKLKVFSGMPIRRGKQFRVIVAATSRNEVVRIMSENGIHETVSHVASHWTITGNKSEIETALSQPGVVFRESRQWSGVYLKLTKEA